MDRSERATELMGQGCNCSQAILTAFGAQWGIEPQEAMNLGRAFGGGMGRLGLTCGAVTGAVMVLGLAGGNEENEPARRQKSYDLVQELVRRFEDGRGTIVCKELLGADLNTEEGRKIIKERGLIATLCPVLVGEVAKILDELLQE